jgi:hypothetical protein
MSNKSIVIETICRSLEDLASQLADLHPSVVNDSPRLYLWSDTHQHYICISICDDIPHLGVMRLSINADSSPMPSRQQLKVWGQRGVVKRAPYIGDVQCLLTELPRLDVARFICDAEGNTGRPLRWGGPSSGTVEWLRFWFEDANGE